MASFRHKALSFACIAGGASLCVGVSWMWFQIGRNVTRQLLTEWQSDMTKKSAAFADAYRSVFGTSLADRMVNRVACACISSKEAEELAGTAVLALLHVGLEGTLLLLMAPQLYLFSLGDEQMYQKVNKVLRLAKSNFESCLEIHEKFSRLAKAKKSGTFGSFFGWF